MGIEYWQLVSSALALSTLLFYGQARYWKARANTLNTERSGEGWASEAKFWRRHFDKESAEWVEEVC